MADTEGFVTRGGKSKQPSRPSSSSSSSPSPSQRGSGRGGGDGVRGHRGGRGGRGRGEQGGGRGGKNPSQRPSTPSTAEKSQSKPSPSDVTKSPPKDAATSSGAPGDASSTASPKKWNELFRGVKADPVSSPQRDGGAVAEIDPNAPSFEDAFKALTITDCLQLAPRGLKNPDNKCFMNSTFQALISCEALYRLTQSLPRSIADMINYPYWDKLLKLVAEFKETSVSGTSGVKMQVYPFTPQFIHNTVHEFNPMSSVWQEDANEYLLFVLDKLHHELIKASAGRLVTVGEDRVADEADGWKEVMTKNKSAVVLSKGEEFMQTAISEVFSGQLQGIVSKRGLDASSRIRAPHITSLSAAFDALVAKEVVEDYKDEEGKVVPATKQTKLASLPKIFILSLNRFAWNELGKMIEYPKMLTLKNAWLSTALVKDTAASKTYRLFGVINHLGGQAQGGHYIADVFNKATQRWVRCDDDRISNIGSEQSVLSSSNAYILFYERI